MKIQTTQEGYTKCKDEYDARILDRVVILEELQRARDLGDLSENGAYHAAREKQSFNEGRIKELEYFIKNAEIVINEDNGLIQLGSSVKIDINGLIKDYLMVGSSEADLASGKLSVDSPVGSSLLGKTEGEKVTIVTPVGEVIYKIIEVK